MKASRARIELTRWETCWRVIIHGDSIWIGSPSFFLPSALTFFLPSALTRKEAMRRAKIVKAALVEVGASI